MMSGINFPLFPPCCSAPRPHSEGNAITLLSPLSSPQVPDSLYDSPYPHPHPPPTPALDEQPPQNITTYSTCPTSVRHAAPPRPRPSDSSTFHTRPGRRNPPGQWEWREEEREERRFHRGILAGCRYRPRLSWSSQRPRTLHMHHTRAQHLI